MILSDAWVEGLLQIQPEHRMGMVLVTLWNLGLIGDEVYERIVATAEARGEVVQ